MPRQQEMEELTLPRGRKSHRGEPPSAAAFTLGTSADSRCGQEAEIPGFALTMEPLPGDTESNRVSGRDGLVLNVKG